MGGSRCHLEETAHLYRAFDRENELEGPFNGAAEEEGCHGEGCDEAVGDVFIRVELRNVYNRKGVRFQTPGTCANRID